MTVDGLRGISISYNILNLPETVSIGNGKVSYIYTSSGEKLATQVGSSLTYYRGPLVYSGNNLLYLVHPEGLTRKSTSGFVYYYAKRDHLGSTRVLCHANGNTLVADQTTGYYPFGLAHGHENLNLNRYFLAVKSCRINLSGVSCWVFTTSVPAFMIPRSVVGLTLTRSWNS